MDEIHGALTPGRWRRELADGVAMLAWHSDGRRLAAASLDGEVVTIDADDGRIDGEVVVHRGGASAVAWRCDDRLSGGADGSLAVGRERIELGGWVGAIDVAPDGDTAVAHGRHVTVLGGASSAPLPSTIASVRWHPDSRRVAVGGFGFVRWLRDGRHDGDVDPVRGGSVESLVASPTGTWMAAGTRGEIVHLWQVDGGGLVQALPCPTSNGRMVGFDGSGRWLAVGSKGGLAVFDLARVDERTGPSGRLLPLFCRPHAVAWCPEAPLVVVGVEIEQNGGGGGLLVIRCDDDAAPVGVLDLGCVPTALVWSPLGDRFAVGGDDGSVQVVGWDRSWPWSAAAGRWGVDDRLDA
jgi:WD40 repeat protein